MGEAKRRKAAGQYPESTRSWATGVLEVSANEMPCFTWSGTQREAGELQGAYLKAISVSGMGVSATSYAKRAAGYLICFGMPQAGRADWRPSRAGEAWSAEEIELYKASLVWLALREPARTGERLEDVFVGKRLLVTFNGDKQETWDYSIRELRGEPLGPETNFTMMAAILEDEHRLDPRDAVSMSTADLFALARRALPADEPIAREPTYVPRIPLDADEANAMMKMTTIYLDVTDPSAGVRTYAGYTDKELTGDKPHLRVR